MDDVARASLTTLDPAYSRNELRKRFASEFRPRPWIYWTDMLLSACIGWICLVVAAGAALGSPLQIAATLGAVLGLYRAVLFIHELSHLKGREIPGFELAWNLFVGIPVQVPSLMYVGSHLDHHRANAFGTEQDPEYAPLARWGRMRLAVFVLTVAFMPLAMPIRWGILGPLSRLVPPLRCVVVERLSTLVINTGYRRPMPQGRHEVRWIWQEAAAALFVWAAVAVLAAGWVPLHVLLYWWFVSAGVWVVNQVRTLAAHGYENEGEVVDSEGQLLDSINLEGWTPLTALLAPVGLRYHALHHYLPSLPYHSLGKVHRRLLADLPQDSAYRRTLRHGPLDPLHKLWDAAESPSP